MTGPEPAPAAAPRTAPTDASSHSPDLRPAVDPRPDARAETMRALRVARRRRRHLMVVCAVIIAVCVVLTLLVVGIARDRRPGGEVVLTAVAPVAWHGAAEPVAHAEPTSPSNPNPDAQASKGAQP